MPPRQRDSTQPWSTAGSTVWLGEVARREAPSRREQLQTARCFLEARAASV